MIKYLNEEFQIPVVNVDMDRKGIYPTTEATPHP
jgi:hypothetical protein